MTLLEMGDRIIPAENADVDEGDCTELREYIEINLRKNSVKQCFGVHVDKIEGNKVYVTDKNESSYIFNADTIVVAAGMRPLEDERERLRDTCTEFISIGDCKKVGRIMEATASGYAAGYYIR